MKNIIIAAYIFVAFSFAGVVDGVDRAYCNKRYSALSYVGVGILWPITMPILAAASFTEQGFTCKDRK